MWTDAEDLLLPESGDGKVRADGESGRQGGRYNDSDQVQCTDDDQMPWQLASSQYISRGLKPVFRTFRRMKLTKDTTKATRAMPPITEIYRNESR